MSISGHYIGPTPITEYGCVRCQKYHRLGLDPEYGPHLPHQSKHGTRRRAPKGPAETLVAEMLAQGIEPANGKWPA